MVRCAAAGGQWAARSERGPGAAELTGAAAPTPGHYAPSGSRSPQRRSQKYSVGQPLPPARANVRRPRPARPARPFSPCQSFHLHRSREADRPLIVLALSPVTASQVCRWSLHAGWAGRGRGSGRQVSAACSSQTAAVGARFPSPRPHPQARRARLYWGLVPFQPAPNPPESAPAPQKHALASPRPAMLCARSEDPFQPALLSPGAMGTHAPLCFCNRQPHAPF